MALCVSNGFSTIISGLGKIKPIKELSEERITKATREALRKKYGESSVEVTCRAKFSSGKWTGKCRIQGRAYDYEIC